MESQTTEQALPATIPTPSSVFVPTTPLDELITVSCIAVCGIVGNGLVLVVLLHYKTYRKKLRNLLIINQSIIDFLTSILMVTTYTSTTFEKTFSSVGAFWCYLIDSELLLYTLTIVSTTNLVAITIERYLMVVFPVIHRNYINRKSIFIAIAVVWAFSIAAVVVLTTYPRIVDGKCVALGTEVPIIKSILSIVFFFWGPVTIFLVLYPHMLYIINKRSKVKPSDPANTQNGKTTRQTKRVQSNLVTVVISVTLAYVLCWGPTFIYYVIISIDASYFNFVIRRYVGFLGFTNSFINPILYAFNYNDFKHGVRYLFKLKQPGTLSTVSASVEE